MNFGGDPIEHQSIYPEGHQTWEAGNTCDECVRLRRVRQARVVSPDYAGALFGVVPGGAGDTIAFERDTERGLNEYGRARSAGLRPVSTKKGGVERTEKLMESQARALKKLDGTTDISQLKTHPGVKESV